MLKEIVARIVGLLKAGDVFVLAKTQVFMDWQQLLTGLNKFMFEKWAIIYSVFFFGTYAFGEGTPTLELFAILYFAWVIALIRGIERQEASFLSNDSLDIPELEQWLRQQAQSTRYHFVVIGGVMLLISFFVAAPMKLLLILGFNVCFIAAQYFTACIPRKPDKDEHVSYSLGL